jgi:vesicular inhibitory amino acid transporter
LGIGLLLAFSALTNYTAKILAKALADDAELMTYADIGAKAFGQTARNFINILFCLEISALW